MQDPRFRQAVGLYQQGQTDHAERLCRQILEQHPDDLDTRQLLSMVQAATGRIQEALTELGRLAEERPEDSQLQMNLASLMRQAGELASAEAILRQLLEKHPGSAPMHSNLGNLLMQAGRTDEAIAAYRSALGCDPDFPDALYNLGVTLQEVGRLADAEKQFAHCVASQPSDADAAYNLGLVRSALAVPGADQAYLQALHYRANDPRIHFAYAMWLSSAGQYDAMRNHFKAAIEAGPDEPRYRIAYAQAVSQVQVSNEDPRFERDLLEMFGYEEVNLELLFLPALALLRHKRGFLLLDAGGRATDPAAISIDELLNGLRDPLLLETVRHCLSADPGLETMLRLARHRLAEAFATLDEERMPEAFLQALAHHVWVNEYLWPEDPGETQWIASRLEEETHNKTAILLLACYRSLYALPRNIQAEASSEPAVAALWSVQVEQANTIRDIGTSVPSLVPITDEVSIRVRDQYESHPYPRWQSANKASAQPLAVSIRSLFPHCDPQTLPGSDKPQVLIAGCGTGRHSLETACAVSGSEVLAVDLSIASLSYAKFMSDRNGQQNISYLQSDLLDLGKLDRRFDLIESVGVLHHMRDPMAGWRVLTDLLAENGLMRIGLYSALGGESILKARESLTRGLEGRDDEIRAIREKLLVLPASDPLANIRNSNDFYSMSSTRDLLFHVQEHSYTLPEISACIDELGLEFLGFDLGTPRAAHLYRQVNPDCVAMTDLACWHAIEQEHPHLFAGMYQFYLRRKR